MISFILEMCFSLGKLITKNDCTQMLSLKCWPTGQTLTRKLSLYHFLLKFKNEKKYGLICGTKSTSTKMHNIAKF